MARKARIKSSTGIYHVLVRAISDLSLFTDKEDTQFYIDILNDLQHKGYCEVYAYALFPTHVHLLIREATPEAPAIAPDGSATVLEPPATVPEASPSGKEPIGSIMKRVASAYSYYFNVKYDHYGPIYLDRFKSNPVETREYFVKVLDHISSQQTDHKYTCRHIPSGLQPSHEGVGQEGPLLDFKPRPLRVTDSRLLAYLQQNHSFTDITEFLQRTSEEQEEVIRNCKKKGGSIRQIVRLTGNTFAKVFKVKV